MWRAAKSDETELGIIGALLQMDIINVFDFEVCVMKVVSILTDLQLIDDTVSGYGWMRDHEVIFLPPGSFEQAMTSGTADNLLGEAELTEEP
ncbi:hypothetical protein DGo_PC0180 (plasmid) [Deinococcus gobiensis I-0]|uniref:Uncharacterized protein n=1 Tax=Deinococcus gobiensis (strain DSM 21396 / JCM 16679 / CGMCC 1.7299 / I-0) TaxID=745776 RepID=H8H375_DEIGI|nr:hypothetical protein DGo_PC0180 [Deinococcus gobiensis I-0]